MVKVYSVIGRSKWTILRMVRQHRIGWVSAERGTGRRLFVDADVIDAIAARQSASMLESGGANVRKAPDS
jgi:hypothetical protein